MDRFIENESFESTFQGLFSEINLNSEKLGKTAHNAIQNFVPLFKKLPKASLTSQRMQIHWGTLMSI